LELAEFETGSPIVELAAVSAASCRFNRRNSLGVAPVSALKARLKGPSELNPVSSAIVNTGTSD
jgi:hypothetical protein